MTNRNTEFQQRVFSVKRAAAALDLSKRTIQRGIAAGKIKAIPLSARRIGIPASEVERIAENGISDA